MTLKRIKLLEIGVRVAPDENSIYKANTFYSDVLGLQMDTQRPEIRGIPGFGSIHPMEIECNRFM